MIYEPREDSFLILEQVKKHSRGNVLEIGTGSGILAQEAAKQADSVLAVDINAEAIEHCKKRVKENNVSWLVSDLFEKVDGKFDLIIFNPPYLPDYENVQDIALDGGKKGYELIEKFLSQAKEHLKENGMILLLFSSLTPKSEVDRIIKENNYSSELVSTKKIDFEELYVYLIK